MPTMSLATAATYETKNVPVELVRFGLRHYALVRYFSFRDDDATYSLHDLCDALYNTAHPTADYTIDTYAPQCHRVVVHQHTPTAGKNLVLALYRTLRIPGKAEVQVKIGGEAIHAKHDLNGKLINGYDRIADDWIRVVRGSDLQHIPKATIIIKTAYIKNQANLGNLLSLIGKCNASALTNLNLGAETCKMLAAPLTRVWDQDALWYANYAMAYDPDGWNKGLATMHHMREVVDGVTVEYPVPSGSAGTVTVAGAGTTRTVTATDGSTFASWMVGLRVAIDGGTNSGSWPIKTYTSGTVVVIDITDDAQPGNAAGLSFQVPQLRDMIATGNFQTLDGYIVW